MSDKNGCAIEKIAFRKEWGIPEWREAHTYGDHAKWSKKRWQWEFFRRRTEVREYFDARAEKTYEHDIELFKLIPDGFPNGRVLRINEPGFQVGVDHADQPNIGYMNLANPRIAAQPELAIFPCTQASRVKSIYGGREPIKIGEIIEKYGINLSQRQKFSISHYLDKTPVKIDKNEIILYFDYNLPIKPQIDAARNFLNAEYTYRKKEKQRRQHPDKWFGYLRALDAKAEGVPLSEISEVFYRDGILDRVSDPAGGYRPPTPQSARDILNAAMALRFNS